MVKNGYYSPVLEVAEVLPNHLLAEPLPSQQKARYRKGRVLQEEARYEVQNPPLWLLVEEVQAHAVLPLSHHFRHLDKDTIKNIEIVVVVI